ncbi:hypothetical protein ADIS_1982 [Lunatimonas lonarensis]|uniref:Uncharacterized protein n=1 Tax=Lunatimonas lonarensis TaxID=1232681 RepID=R7ZU08_9BACT|nr:hypothetical protein ADIS_1982 [Lunatimonas lonarensis]
MNATGSDECRDHPNAGFQTGKHSYSKTRLDKEITLRPSEKSAGLRGPFCWLASFTQL